MDGDYSRPQVIENDDPNDPKYSSWDVYAMKQHAPITVVDDQFTNRSPSCDRALMVQVADYLSEKIYTILIDDLERNKRYATALIISNMEVEGPKAGTRETICVPLQASYVAWNEIDPIEIQFLILRRINPLPHEFYWYKVRALLTSFIDKETFDNLQAMDNQGTNA